ncbi:ParA family protein [Thermodesulfobacteriota bacterium]
MKKIGICNNKGGVGKTTVTLCLAGAMAQMNKKVLLVDMDQQGSLSSSFLPDIHNLSLVITDAIRDDLIPIKEIIKPTKYENIDIVPANLSLGKLESELISERDSHYYLADKLEEIQDNYDVILVDSPPNLGLATWSVLTASEGVIIPLEAQDYSVKGTGYVHGLVQKVKKRANPKLDIIGYIINRYDGRRRIEQDFRAMIEKHLGEKVFKQVLKDSVMYVESVTLGKPITFFAPKSEHAEAFRQIGKEVLNV